MRLDDTKRQTLADHLGKYPKPEAVIFMLYPKIWRAARRQGLSAADIRGICHEGLMKAASKWEGKCLFKTFAVRASRWAVLRFLRRKQPPRTVAEFAGESVGGTPLRTIRDIPQPATPNEPANGIPDEIREPFQRLKQREQYILALRFGLGGEPPHTLVECGEICGVSPSRVRQIEAGSRRKIRYAIQGA